MAEKKEEAILQREEEARELELQREREEEYKRRLEKAKRRREKQIARELKRMKKDGASEQMLAEAEAELRSKEVVVKKRWFLRALKIFFKWVFWLAVLFFIIATIGTCTSR